MRYYHDYRWLMERGFNRRACFRRLKDGALALAAALIFVAICAAMDSIR